LVGGKPDGGNSSQGVGGHQSLREVRRSRGRLGKGGGVWDKLWRVASVDDGWLMVVSIRLTRKLTESKSKKGHSGGGRGQKGLRGVGPWVITINLGGGKGGGGRRLWRQG